MRTTLTLDADVAVLVEKARETTRKSLKEIVNDRLRRGLSEKNEGSGPHELYSTPPAELGGCLLPDLDDVAGALLVADAGKADLIPDAHLAALAMEYGLILQTTDRDFARFQGLRWENPLAVG